MNFDIRLPNITGTTEKEMLVQIRSYLYQLAPQLQFALEDINKRQETFSYSDPQRSITPSLGGVGTSNANPQDTFASIKALIIKSADIVNAYYEEINRRLVGEYVAVSDFGTFRQETEATITETSTSITNAFSNIQTISDEINTKYDGIVEEIEGDIDEVKEAADAFTTYIRNTQAYIKTGLLEDGIYGIEVGQTNTDNGNVTFNKYARFTSDKLSFYDKSDVEVAYISGYKLHITTAEIKGSLKLGGFLFDTTNGLTVKWEGRS